jgi:hypothetical protein
MIEIVKETEADFGNVPNRITGEDATNVATESTQGNDS